MTSVSVGQSVRTRVAWRLLPFLFLLYVANYLDRTNIAYAALGMKGELGLSDSVFGTASGIFFIGYFALQIPGALLVERWSARRLLASTLIAWGLLTALTAFVRTSTELYGARFLLGAAEAGFFPGVIVYLSHWFVPQDRAKAVARFMAAIPIGFILGGPIAAAILKNNWLALPGWRWLFLFEGIPAVILGGATFFVLPDRPADAGWLSPQERAWITNEFVREREAKSGVEKMTIWQALRHGPVLLLTAALFCTYTGGYIFWLWFPTILQRLTGWTTSMVAWWGVVVFGTGLIGMLVLGVTSDRWHERRWHFAVPQLTAAVALAAWLCLPHSHTLLIVLCSFLAFGTIAYLPSFWALPSEFLSASAAAAAVGFINCTASLGGYFGPKIFGDLSQHHGGNFDRGFLLMIACWTIASVLVLMCPRGHRSA